MKEKKTFESAMAELTDTVKLLESGTLSLDDSLAAFERAIGLVRYCGGELDRARQRVRILTEGADGTVTDHPFTPESDDEA